MTLRLLLLAALAALLTVAFGCGQTTTTPPGGDDPDPDPVVLFGDLEFGDDATLDVVTWNLHNYPSNGQTSVRYVAAAVRAMDADVVAFQEIAEGPYFDSLLDSLAADGYDGAVTPKLTL